MLDHPFGITDPDLIFALTDAWALNIQSAQYLPVGAGSYHWSVTSRDRAFFVSVDDLGPTQAAFNKLSRALNTALALHRDAGLEFVVAPIPTRTGSTLWRLGPRHAVALYPMLDGIAGEFGPHRPEDLPELRRLLAALHRATPTVAAHAPRADLTLPGRTHLEAALHTLHQPWTGGPYSEPTRRLLISRADHISQLLTTFDQLADEVRPTAATWVITHGEPHPGNILRTPTGLHLIDWDTVQIAPPARDLWMLPNTPDSPSLALYQLWWPLADIAIYTNDLRHHHPTPDTTAAWNNLNKYLE